MGGGAWPFLVGGAICPVNSVNEARPQLANLLCGCKPYPNFLEDYGLRPWKFEGNNRSLQLLVFNEEFLVKRESSARVDYVPALCTHRPSLLPIEWSGEVFGSLRCGRFAACDSARSPLNLII
ncbi:hypothetical protein HPP92_006833 [Vanilla planifolia]|uniref:Uncharacterized protein n=1 Tax=Vanilla planifolia TaxID=51239 RepID=A0A835VAN9_VANPL|nr:hypothetical protein HPP92_006833 [Vanilla planifolia]